VWNVAITFVPVILIIGFFVFTTPTNELIDFLTEIGQMAGGRTTIGVFILAALPPLTGFICYYFWKWVLK